jgi:glyoxylase-like metal-dependent hydrolase (beta-lactamase superfamily II)
MPHEPFALGSFEVVPLCDGWAPLPLSDEIPGRDIDWDEERRRFPWAFPPDDAHSWAWHVHSFLLRHPDGLMLIDTGIGHLGRPPYDVSSTIDEELNVADVLPEDVGHVVLTHLHADHSGGACLPDGNPRFPNARYHVHPEDWSFFAEHRTPDDFTGRFAMAAMEELGMLELDASDHEVLRGVSLEHAPGHTPGHRVVQLDDGNATLLLTGDLLHVPPQVAYPDSRSNHDEDPAVAARERSRLVDQARTEGWAVGVSHFARPFGRVGHDGWTPIEGGPR